MTNEQLVAMRDTFRLQQHPLNDVQKQKVQAIKCQAMNMEKVLLNCIGYMSSQDVSALNMCMTKLQEMVFWATYHVTAPVIQENADIQVAGEKVNTDVEPLTIKQEEGDAPTKD